MILHKSYLLILFAFYALCCWLLFGPMIEALHDHWVRPNDLDAGYLLLAFMLYVFWKSSSDNEHAAREAGEHTQSAEEKEGDQRISRVQVAGAIALFGCCSLAALTAITANKSATLALLLIGFIPLCMAVWGKRSIRPVAHGCAILFMATPIWFVIVPALQGLTATAVNVMLQAGRWSVYVENNFIFLPNGALEIAAGCAGLKFVQTALALTLIEGFLARRGFRAMLTIAAVAVVLSMLCNWLRVAAITLMALYLELNHPWVADHNWVGWVLFALLFGPLFYWLGNVTLFAKVEPPTSTTGTIHGGLGELGKPSQKGIAVAALALAVSLSGVWGLTQLTHSGASARVGQKQLQAVDALCQTGVAHPATAVFPGAQFSIDCRLDELRYLSLRGYLTEAQDSEIVNPNNELVPRLSMLDFRVSNARTPQQVPGRYDDGQLSVAYGYYTAGRWTAAPTEFKLRSLTRPFNPGPVWALVLISAPAGNATANDAELTAGGGLNAAFNRVADQLANAL